MTKPTTPRQTTLTNPQRKQIIAFVAIVVVLFHLGKKSSTVQQLLHSAPTTTTKNEPPNTKVILQEVVDPICRRALHSLLKEKIRLVAIDFDMTMINIHTGGRWEGDVDLLSKHVRPEFQCLVQNCEKLGIHVAIATFSTQKELLQGVILPMTVEKNSQTPVHVPIFGRQDVVKGYSKGKQSQLLLAMKHFNDIESKKKGIVIITPRSTTLIDDDEDNIRIAQRDGYRTILYDPDNSGNVNALRCCLE